MEKMTLFGKLTLVLRGPDGRIKAVRSVPNMKVYGTFNVIASAVGQGQTLSACYLGLGSGPDVASADTALSGEVLSRTIGRYSHDANSPSWNLSFSFTDSPVTVSIGQAGILTSLTGGTLFLKATFARLTKMSQDLLNVAWLQSLASA
jgi:hypothetical protein